jgi:hypothetical protein
MKAIVLALATSMNGGTHAGDLGRARAPRARRRRAKLRLMIGLHEDDLREIALRGYDGAASSDRTLQAEAVTLFLTDILVGA